MKRWRMKTKVELSIVIVSHNTRVLLENCLDSIVGSLNSSHIRYEVIIVDNVSRDGSGELVKTLSVFFQFRNRSNCGREAFQRGSDYSAFMCTSVLTAGHFQRVVS